MYHSLRLGMAVAALCWANARSVEAAWPIAGAAARCVIERAADAAAGADTGYALLFPLTGEQAPTAVEITTMDGKPVRHQILWSAPGEPTKVLFDCSGGASTFAVYPRPANRPAPAPWTPPAGLILETRDRAPGTADTVEQLMAICAASTNVQGRTPVPRIFHGVQPHGPPRDVVSLFRGVFHAPSAGVYTFATVSDDASCLSVDGKLVAAWPGWHGAMDGRMGEHNGDIQLAAGPHTIDYRNVEYHAGLCLLAAWRKPGERAFQVMPADAFPPVASFETKACEPTSPAKPIAAFAWRIECHSMVDDMPLVTVSFTALNRDRPYTYRWQFDDGVRQEGATVHHVFCRPGTRDVTLRLETDGKPVSESRRSVRVHPQWLQHEEWNDARYEEQKKWLLGTGMAAHPVEELAALLRIVDRVKDIAFETQLAGLCFQRKDEFGTAQADVFYLLGLHMQHPTLQRYDLAEQAFRRADALADNDPSLRAACRLHCAGMLIHCLQRFSEAQELLARADATVMDDTNKRLKTIYEADALLALGHAAAARALYAAAGTVVDRGNLQYAVRRRARLQTAKDYLDRREYDAAEESIRNIEWETPLERINTETGLVMIQAEMGREQYRMAYAHCHRLLQVSETDSRRPQILYLLGQICVSMSRRDEARETLKLLADNYPYSEATAFAREGWGAKL